jgi:hypothetical protein
MRCKRTTAHDHVKRWSEDSVGELGALTPPGPAGAINRASTHWPSLRSAFFGDSPTESTIHGRSLSAETGDIRIPGYGILLRNEVGTQGREGGGTDGGSHDESGTYTFLPTRVSRGARRAGYYLPPRQGLRTLKPPPFASFWELRWKTYSSSLRNLSF